MKTRFFLPIHTTPDLFYEWIKIQVYAKNGAYFSYKGGLLKLFVPPSFEKQERGTYRLVTKGIWMPSNPDLQEDEVLVFEMTLTQTKPDEIKMHSNFFLDQYPNITEWYDNLIALFIDDYPEATSKPEFDNSSSEPGSARSESLPIRKPRPEVRLQFKKAGRRVDPYNDHAWEMIQNGGGNEHAWEEAFRYWCQERNLQVEKARNNDRYAFKKAMARASKRFLKMQDEIGT